MSYLHKRPSARRVYPTIFPFCVILVFTFFIFAFPGFTQTQTSVINWEKISRVKPELKVMVRVISQFPFSLGDLATMAQFGMVPADRDPGMVLGLRKAIFSVKLKNWNRKQLPSHLQATLLNKFIMTGIYRLSFKVEQEGYNGPLSLTITTPRSDFGKQLLSSEQIVRPRGFQKMYVDSTGNRWFFVDYPKVRNGETIRFHFAFKYQVEMGELLKHDLMLLDQTGMDIIPDNIKPFLGSGLKIDTQIPEVIEWAKKENFKGLLNVRSTYLKVRDHIKRTIHYDNQKKARYFGGKAVYYNLDDMYQDIPLTLFQKMGACPDTSLLECAYMRAMGIPCRTAGRFGHFLTHVFVPGKGWLSTLIHPTGIPLVVAPGPDNISYQKWSPAIGLKTVTLETKIRIDSMEDLP